MTDHSFSIAVLGAGSWGTALALQLAYAGHQVSLWGRDRQHLEQVNAQRENQRYLPGVAFPENLTAEQSLETVVTQNTIVLIAVPSSAYSELLTNIKGIINSTESVKSLHPLKLPKLVSATKGLYQGQLLHKVAEQILPELDYAVLSGPSFAQEVAKQLPTTVIIASQHQHYAEQLALAFSSQFFRVYTSNDLLGVEIGGALKNVLAVAVGISDGMGFGANARAALITRGLNEMVSLGQTLGADSKTITGLSGLGDLVLTCTDDQSRNRRFGLAIGNGKTIVDAEKSIGQVVESANTAREVYQLAKKLNLEMPITEQVYQVIHQGLSAREAVKNLFSRKLKSE